MAVLPDINVLLALIYGAHVHHAAAVAWIDGIEQAGGIILCRVTQLGLLRLLNNPAVMGPDVQGGTEVWRTWDTVLADDRFGFQDEPESFETRFRLLSAKLGHQPRLWQDAYLAAFALAADFELVTFDAGFRAFPGLRHRILAPDARSAK